MEQDDSPDVKLDVVNEPLLKKNVHDCDRFLCHLLLSCSLAALLRKQ